MDATSGFGMGRKASGNSIGSTWTWILAALVFTVSAVTVSNAQSIFSPLTLSSSPVFALRHSFSTWTANNSIFLYGGASSVGLTSFFADVWVSPNAGVTWTSLSTLPNPGGAGGSLAGASAVSFKGYHYIFGGLGGGGCTASAITFQSPNTGTSLAWSTFAAPWSARAFGMATVWTPALVSGLPPQIIYMGGATECNSVPSTVYSDIWSLGTTTGTTWSQLSTNAVGSLYGAGITTIHNGASIIVAGGATSGGSSPTYSKAVYLGVWTSGTAPSWYTLTSSAPWSGRFNTLASTSENDDYLYTITGEYGSPITNDVWASYNGGVTWTGITSAATFSARSGAGLASLGRELLLFGGQNGATVYNDVWYEWEE